MTIDLNTATDEEIIAAYNVDERAITEVLSLLADAAESGANLRDPGAVPEFVQGITLAIQIANEVPELARVAASLIGTSQFCLDYIAQAQAAGKQATLMDVGNALTGLAGALLRAGAADGKPGYPEALAEATDLGLL